MTSRRKKIAFSKPRYVTPVMPPEGTVRKSLPKGLKCKHCSKPFVVRTNHESHITWVWCATKKCPNKWIMRDAANYGITWGLT